MAKVAILSFYSGLIDRGVETFARELASRLAIKHQVTVFQTGSVSPQKFKIKQVSSPKIVPKSTQNLTSKLYLDNQSFGILIFSLRVLPQILKEKYDVIIPLNGGWQTVIYRITCKIKGSKLIVSGQAGIGSDDAWNLLARPDVFVAPTRSEGNWANNLVPEVSTVVIANGVDLSRFNPKQKPADVPLKKPIVVCASALDPYKRVDLTIKAVAKTKYLSLLVLGDGQMRGSIDSLGKRILGERYLRLLVPYEQMPSYYRAGKVFTLASKTEAFGISYVEAMACNLPVVTTNDDSRADIIGDAGILTNPDDSDQYAKDLTIAARTNYKNIPYNQSLKFSWNKIAQKYADLISRMLA